MKAILNAILWEILWKNRVVFPALAVLLGLGAVLAAAGAQADPSAPWLAAARTLTIMTFLISVLIGFTPFTLMESGGGWRMNSMLTRWFALPMGTAAMVFLPALAGCLFIALLVGAWMPVLNRIAPGLDAAYFIGVLGFGQLAITALAWTVPRKPVQFWTGLGVLFPILLILAFAPQERPNQEQFRRGLFIPLTYLSVALAAFTWFAARKNRCGAWPGELRLDWLWGSLRGRSGRLGGAEFRSPFWAMFSAECLPTLRLLAISWSGLVLGLFTWISLQLRDSHMAAYAFSWRLIPSIGLNMLPILGILWMACWGIFSGGEPAAAFRARLSSFRSTLPVSCGVMAGERIAMLAFGWCIVWLPLAGLSFFHDEQFTGVPSENLQTMQTMLARFMAVGAYVLVGALPLYLWGRFEGFPNFLLAGVCVWGLAWGISSNLKVEAGQEPGWRWLLIGALLALKAGAALSGLVAAWRKGHVTWRFPACLLGGWLAVVGLLLWGMPTWKSGGLWAALALAVMVPLARLAWCPLAIAANRHR